MSNEVTSNEATGNPVTRNKVTSMQVAQKAEVSQSAVSRVFTPGASVSYKKANKIRRIANEMGYRPNVIARTLSTGKSKIIGLIVAYLDNQFYPESLQKISQQLQSRGYHILIFTVDNTKSQIEKTVQELIDYQVDAIIAASVSMNNEITQYCRKKNVPIVLYNRAQDDKNISFVTSDNIAGGITIADHFADINVQRPAYIAGWQGASTQRDREIGFTKGLEKHNIKLFGREIGNFNINDARIATLKLFENNKIPDGIFVANDHMAFAVMDTIRYEIKMKIPQDIVVAGYDDVAIAQWPAYNLTSVRQAANKMVKETINILMQTIQNPNTKPVHIKIKSPLIIRESTRKIK